MPGTLEDIREEFQDNVRRVNILKTKTNPTQQDLDEARSLVVAQRSLKGLYNEERGRIIKETDEKEAKLNEELEANYDRNREVVFGSDEYERNRLRQAEILRETEILRSKSSYYAGLPITNTEPIPNFELTEDDEELKKAKEQIQKEAKKTNEDRLREEEKNKQREREREELLRNIRNGTYTTNKSSETSKP